EWRESVRVMDQLPESLHAWQSMQVGLEQAHAELARAARHDAHSRPRECLVALASAKQHLAQTRSLGWTTLVDGPMDVIANPLARHFESLPTYWRIARTGWNTEASINLLRGGNCEDMSVMRAAGWRIRHEGPAAEGASALLTSQRPHDGTHGLELALVPRQVESSSRNDSLPTPDDRLIVTSPELSLAAGQLVSIQGWIYLSLRDGAMPTSTARGGVCFEISDSLTGDSERWCCQRTGCWIPFRLIRAGDSVHPLVLSMTLHGDGQATLDDIVVRPLAPSSKPTSDMDNFASQESPSGLSSP
ncbi:MAG TPA: hypothetical protein VIY86_05055, partial [Pirellulaceae bacterium]